MSTTLVAVRLERTRDVLRELARSLRQALPIVIGVAGPIFVASFALLAWAGVPPMKAVTLPWRSGVSMWLAQAAAAAWPLWALRRRLLPEAWCVQLRCLPLAAGALWRSDVAVSATVLSPLAVVYGVSGVVFALQRPAWWLQVWPLALASLAASWIASCLLGAAALALQRRGVAVRARRAMAAQTPEQLLSRRPSMFDALLWQPWWRGAMTPGGASVVAGAVSALIVAAAWTGGVWPVVPGAAWALVFVAWLVGLTERIQRAMEGHLERLEPWLVALPADAAWRWQARVLVCVPMAVLGLAAVALVLALRPWRALPLAFFALGVVALPATMASVPSSNREAHVGLWAVGVGLLTALGSELWN